MAKERGREAHRPQEIPARGWREIVLRVKDEQAKDNLSIVAAGVAFFLLLAIFPALAAAVAIFALVADPAQLEAQLQPLRGMIPDQAFGILQRQLSSLVEQTGGGVGVGAAVGILFSLWSATKGMKVIMTALNIAYEEEERRGVIAFNALALLLTLGMILGGLVALGLIVVLPAVFNIIGLGSAAATVIAALRWPLLAVFFTVALAVLYRYGPSRARPRWQWVSPGAVLAAVVWLLASVLFSIYVRNFGSYHETYGSLGAMIILLMWLYISAYVALLGAELNAEMEHQTRRDTTRGADAPMGVRGAEAADTVADPDPKRE